MKQFDSNGQLISSTTIKHSGQVNLFDVDSPGNILDSTPLAVPTTKRKS